MTWSLFLTLKRRNPIKSVIGLRNMESQKWPPLPSKWQNTCADQGWENIHIAFPFNPLEIPKLNKIAAHQSISVQLINATTAQMLVDQLEQKVGFFMKSMQDMGEQALRSQILGWLKRFWGFQIILISYFSKASTFMLVIPLHAWYSSALWAKLEMPSRCWNMKTTLNSRSCHPNRRYSRLCCNGRFRGYWWMGPGNFVFFDLMQAKLGGCDLSDIAVAMAVPVVGYQKRSQGNLWSTAVEYILQRMYW